MSLGDLVLDVVVRIDSEIARGADTPARTSLSAGGQAANVAAWASALGASARWLGKRAADAPGLLAAEELERRGVELAGPVRKDRVGGRIRDLERNTEPIRHLVHVFSCHSSRVKVQPSAATNQSSSNQHGDHRGGRLAQLVRALP